MTFIRITFFYISGILFILIFKDIFYNIHVSVVNLIVKILSNMSEVPDSISNSNNQLLNDVNNTVLEIEKTSTDMTNTNITNNNNSLQISDKSLNEMTTLSSCRRYGNENNRLDIDIDYAVELLKREDQNLNV